MVSAGFLTRCPGKHLFRAPRGSEAIQIGNMERNSKEEKLWLSIWSLESETQEVRDMFGAEGSALTPSITHLMRR